MNRLPLFFYRYLSSRFLGSVVYNAFIIYFLWELVVATKSVFLAGLIPTIALAANLIAAIPVGHLIDRFNSTKLSMVSSILLLAGCALLVANQTVLPVYASTAFVSVGVMMKGDTISATIKKHLGRDQFTPANQSLQAAGYASSLTGTVLGGASIIYLRSYFAPTILALSVIALLFSLPIPEVPNRELKQNAMSELVSSIGFIKKIGGFLVVGFVLNGLFVSLDVYSSGLFHLVLDVSSIYYKLFVAFLAVGGVIGSTVSGKVQKHVNTANRISFLILLFSPAILFIALSGNAALD
ncbi:MAG: MFS transporter, partial [Thermoprotei archaeon]